MKPKPSHATNNRRALKERRRELRSGCTPAEARLWRLLSGRKLDGLKFRRQQSIGPFIVDFCCPSDRLIVELDGEVHNDPLRAAYDEQRQDYLEALGYSVLRFENRLVFEQPEYVLEASRMTAAGFGRR